MTLTELASKFRELYKFDYIVVESSHFNTLRLRLWISERKPIFTKYGWDYNDNEDFDFVEVSTEHLIDELDLSEYADDNGNIDYSKCIVKR